MPKRIRKSSRPLLPNYIRQWREYRNKTQDQLAEAVGISTSHLSRIERGEREYMQSLLEAMSEYLETDPGSLLMRDPTQAQNIWSLWDQASIGQKQDIERLARVVIGDKKQAG